MVLIHLNLLELQSSEEERSKYPVPVPEIFDSFPTKACRPSTLSPRC